MAEARTANEFWVWRLRVDGKSATRFWRSETGLSEHASIGITGQPERDDSRLVNQIPSFRQLDVTRSEALRRRRTATRLDEVRAPAARGCLRRPRARVRRLRPEDFETCRGMRRGDNSRRVCPPV